MIRAVIAFLVYLLIKAMILERNPTLGNSLVFEELSFATAFGVLVGLLVLVLLARKE